MTTLGKTTLFFLLAFMVMLIQGNDKINDSFRGVTCVTKDRHFLLKVLHFCETHLVRIASVDLNKPEVKVSLSPEQSSLFRSTFHGNNIRCRTYREGEVEDFWPRQEEGKKRGRHTTKSPLNPAYHMLEL